MTAPTMTYEEVQETVAELRSSKISDIHATATEYGLKLPKSWTKAELVAGLESYFSGEDMSSYMAPEAPKVPEQPKTPEDVKSKVEAHRLSMADAEAMRIEAEKSRPKKVTWEATVEELEKRHSRLGYAIGVMAWAKNRIEKESKVVSEVLPAMGESFDSEAVSLSREALILGYAKSLDQFGFPSPAIKGKANPDDIFAEIMGIFGNLEIFSTEVAEILQDQPEELETEGEEGD